MVKFLLVGEDFRLLATRAAVLARTGANTVCCSPAEMLRDLRSESFELVVICHSLAEQSAATVAKTAREWWPETKVLLIRLNEGQQPFNETECDAIINPEPAATLREASALLRKLPARTNGALRASAT